MATKVAVTLSTVERMLDEVDKYTRKVQELGRKLERLKPGSPAYHDLLPELWVLPGILNMKVKHAWQATIRGIAS